MNNDILNTIEVLSARVSAKEEETNKLKKLVNELCVEAGIEAKYQNVSRDANAVSAVRSDQYYGQSLTAAIRNYLERRNAANLGPAGPVDIYKAIKEGGFKFGTANEENARISVGNALRKTSSIFHRLPNGQYGLLNWYPNAKAPPEADTRSKPKSKAKRQASPKSNGMILVSNQEIRDAALAYTGQFQAGELHAALKARFPGKDLPPTKVPNVLFLLKKKGLIKQVSPKSGSRPAIYSKI